MLARRSRLQIKPNISKTVKTASKPTENLEESTASTSSEAVPVEATVAVEESASVGNAPAAEETVAVPRSLADFVQDLDGPSEPAPPEPRKEPVKEPEVNYVDLLAPERRIAHTAKDVRPRFSSTNDCLDTSPAKNSRNKRKFTGDEELDPKKMRMMDMIFYNPKKGKSMTRKHDTAESVIGENPTPSPEKQPTATSTPKVAAPQVKIGADGRLVIDEESLVVENESTNDSSIWETVDEDRMTRKVSSLSFRNRMWRKGTSWTEKENELFYEILRCTGPDFGLMHEFFPTRARNELKSKFNREERTNWAKLKEVMSRPALLDEDLYERAADLQREIEEEALAKKLKKEKATDNGTGMTTRRRRKKKVDEEEAADNSEDLIEEATQIINSLEKERMKKTKKKKRRRHSWSDSSESSDTEISEESGIDEDDENEIEQEDEDVAGTSENIAATEKKKASTSGKRKRIRSTSSSESAISESNIVDEPRKIMKLTRKNEKKLSATAEALLKETLELIPAGGQQRDAPVEAAESAAAQAYEGYDEENADIGSADISSIQTIDSDVMEDSRRPNLLVRARRTAQITRSSELLIDRNRPTPTSSNHPTEEEAVSPKAASENTVENAGGNEVEEECRDGPSSSTSPEPPVVPSTSHDTERQRAKPNIALNRKLATKKQPNKPRSGKADGSGEASHPVAQKHTAFVTETEDTPVTPENTNDVEKTADKPVNPTSSMVTNVERNNHSVGGSLESPSTSLKEQPLVTPTSEETQLSRPLRHAKNVVVRRAPPKRQPNRATSKKNDKKGNNELHNRDSTSDKSAEEPSTSVKAQECTRVRRSAPKEGEEATANDTGEKSCENNAADDSSDVVALHDNAPSKPAHSSKGGTPIPVEVELKRPTQSKRGNLRKSRGRR